MPGTLESSLLAQTITHLKVDYKRLTVAQNLLVYRATIHQMRGLLFTNFKNITTKTVDILIDDLNEIMKYIDEWREDPDMITLQSVDAVLKKIEEASNELFVAASVHKADDMNTEEISQAFANHLTLCRKYLGEVIRYFPRSTLR